MSADEPAAAPSTSARLRAVGAVGLPVAIAAGGIAIGLGLADPARLPLVVVLGIVVLGLVAVLARDGLTRDPDDLGLLRRSASAALRRELDRARRHRRSFAVVRVPLGGTSPDRAAADGGDGIAAATIRLIGTALRITDSAWVDGDAILVLLPEADRSMAEAFLHRARLAAPERFAERAGIALFPDDGMTSGALLAAAEQDMHGEPVPQPIAPTIVGADSSALVPAEPAETGLG